LPVGFEWDPPKAASNATKRAVSFEEAMTAFADPLARIFGDPDHSAAEHREILVGHSASLRLLVVGFVEHESGVRIFSARAATSRERRDHEASQ
jgi:hypothetical protein